MEKPLDKQWHEGEGAWNGAGRRSQHGHAASSRKAFRRLV